MKVWAIGWLAALLASGCVNVAYQAGRRQPLDVPAGIVHEEARVKGVKDVTLFQESWHPAPGAPVKAVLVIMHGLKDHADRYHLLAERAVAHGIAVYAFDLRGHGDSEGPRVWVDGFQDYVDDLAHFIAQVRARELGKPLFLLGHSMGGAIALMTTLQSTQPPNGLILSAPALRPGGGVGGFEIFSTNVLGTIFPTLAVFKLDDSQFSHDPKVAEAMRQDPLVFDGAHPAHTAKELLWAMDTNEKQMDRLQIPVLILDGTEDQVTNPEGSKLLSAKASSRDISLILYPGMFHDLLHETNAEQVMGDILAWLDARDGQAPRAHLTTVELRKAWGADSGHPR